MTGIVLPGHLPGEQPAAQPSDFEAIQVAQGSPDDRGRGPRGRLQAVTGQDLEGLRSVLVNHRSQGISFAVPKIVGEVL